MLNGIWIAMVFAAVLCGALSGRMDAVAKASTDSAGTAVNLAIGLVGVMTFWLGAMAVVQRAGLAKRLADALAPLLRRIFPDVPRDHPATGSMLMNFVANMLGLGNAATPFGLRAMTELESLNRHKGVATNAMVLFLAINTSGLGVLPTNMIALRASLDSASPALILVPTWIASLTGLALAIVSAKLLARLVPIREAADAPLEPPKSIDTTAAEAAAGITVESVGGWRRYAVLGAVTVLFAAVAYTAYEGALGTPEAMVGLKSALAARPVEAAGWRHAFKTVASAWPLPLLMLLILSAGMFKRIKVYDVIVEAGREGFQTALRIIPYLVVMLVAIGMLRASGALRLFEEGLEPFTSLIGMPAEALPMLLLRPLSGSGTYALAAEIMKTHGPDSFIGLCVSTMYGSSETTFYVLALYFGVVGVRRIRHALAACLITDVGAMLVAVWAVRLVL